MNTKLTKLFKRLRALFPSRLPVGVSEFNTWAADLIEIYDLPNNDSIRFALAVSILHTESATFYKAKEFYGRSMLKAAANEIAGSIVQELKNKQQAAIAAAQAKQAEVTASPVETSNGPQQ